MVVDGNSVPFQVEMRKIKKFTDLLTHPRILLKYHPHKCQSNDFVENVYISIVNINYSKRVSLLHYFLFGEYEGINRTENL